MTVDRYARIDRTAPTVTPVLSRKGRKNTSGAEEDGEDTRDPIESKQLRDTIQHIS